MKHLTKRERIMIGVAVCTVVICFYLFVYEPKAKEASRLKEKIQTINLEIEQIVNRIPDIKRLEQEITREQEKISLAKKSTSGKQQLQQLLRQLARDVSMLDIDVISLELKEESEPSHETSRYKRMTMVIDIQCRYHHLGSYLKKLRDLPGLFIIERLEIRRDSQIYPKLQVKLVLYTFIAHEIPVKRGERL